MNINQDLNNKNEYELLLAEVKNIEAEIMPQLEMLGKEIPEIYGEYAKVVRETVNNTLSLLSLNEKTSSNIMLAAEIGSRTLEAYGSWQAARKHNKMLDKFLETKRRIANLNYVKIEKALSEALILNEKIKKLFDAYCRNEYDITGQNKETVDRLANLIIRQLTLYRANLFITRICEYLKLEYSAWQNNLQTSNKPQPDYFSVNEEILNKIVGKNIFKAIEEAGDSTGELTGFQIMLLADPQLTLFCLKDTICRINIKEASEPVRFLLIHNPGIHYYTEKISPLIKQMNDNPTRKILLNGFLCLAIVICICVFFIPDKMWAINTGILSAIAIYRIIRVNSKKAKIYHVTDTIETAAQTDDVIESYCGKVNKLEIDYMRKDALSESLKTFFN